MVSAVIPAYNAARFIERTLDTVRTQTFQGHETVVVDDGSVDATADVVQAYFAEHRMNGRVVRQGNRGMAAARNAGMREEAITAMREGSDTSKLEPDERDIINYTRELLRTNRVSQATFDSLMKRHDSRWVVEITATIGQYQYIAAINNAFEMEPRADGEKLPIPSPALVGAR